MRLADRFVAGDWYFPLGIDETRPFVADAAADVQNHPVLLAENVAEYVDQRGETELSDYPSLAPPWPSFWIEYPSTSRGQRRGVWVSDVSSSDHPVCRSALDAVDKPPPHPAHPFYPEEADPVEIRWVVAFFLFVEHRHGVWGPVGNSCVSLDDQGAVIGRVWDVSLLVEWMDAAKEPTHLPADMEEDDPDWEPPTLAQMQAMSDEERRSTLTALEERRALIDRNLHRLDVSMRRITEKIEFVEDAKYQMAAAETLGLQDWLHRALAPAFQAVAFLHCRNVEVEEHDAPPKVQAKRKRRGKKPLLRYHTLRLVVPRKQTEGDAGAETHTKALHIVAGHFAHYGSCCTSHEPKGLLFGKHEGVYWVASHVRGNADRGIVRTDFDLVAP